MGCCLGITLGSVTVGIELRSFAGETRNMVWQAVVTAGDSRVVQSIEIASLTEQTREGKSGDEPKRESQKYPNRCR
jgi:hypothetical protein